MHIYLDLVVVTERIEKDMQCTCVVYVVFYYLTSGGESQFYLHTCPLLNSYRMSLMQHRFPCFFVMVTELLLSQIPGSS